MSSKTSLPEAFAERMKILLREEYEAFLAAYEKPRSHGLRANLLKITPEVSNAQLVFDGEMAFDQTGWMAIPVPGGFRYDWETLDAGRHPYYQAGLYYLQEPSAMLPAAVLGIQSGDRVLDMCAAPGGKSTAAAASLAHKGLLVANDISASRCKALLKNLEVFGADNICVTNGVPAKMAEQMEGVFDRILLDAPCSGEGMFRKDAANARAWSPEKVLECAAIQKTLADAAVRMLRPGGHMVYSTCTFSPEEDEETVAYLLLNHPEMELCEIPWQEGFSRGRKDILAPETAAEAEGLPLERCVRIFPHHMDGEGHFLALLHKKEEAEYRGPDPAVLPLQEYGKEAVPEKQGRREKSRGGKRKKGPEAEGAAPSGGMRRLTKQELACVQEFLAGIRGTFPTERLRARKDQVFLIPQETVSLEGIPVLRCGMLLGELKKDRFEPAQCFAMYLKKEQAPSALDLPAGDDRVLRYLKGETLLVEPGETPVEKGWQLVCVDGHPLGWGRLSAGILKNKYLAGWRV